MCKDCKKTFSPSTDIVENNSNIFNNLKYTIALDLKENISLTNIARRYNVSVSSVQRIMDKCYQNPRNTKRYLPETLCFDEFKSVKNIDGAMSLIL